MIPAELPNDERSRLGDLFALGILDSPSDPAFDRITKLAQRLFDVPISLVSFVDADRQWFKSSRGLDATETPRDLAFCAHAIHGDEVFVVENACEDPRFGDNPLVTADPSIRFYAGAPIHAPSGRRLGTLCVIDTKVRNPCPGELETLQDLAAIVDEEIAQLAMSVTDQATGLHNRRGFVTAAEQILAVADRTRVPTVLVYADLDGLKRLNDEHGHAAGDHVLGCASKLLRSTFREADVIARLGGDEFAALLFDATAESAGIAIDRLGRAIEHRNQLDESGYRLGLSIGCAERRPGEKLPDLLARADAAMYEVKRRL